MINTYKLFQCYEKLFGKDYYYLILMTFYHIEILLLVTFLGINYNVNTFLPMITPDKVNDYWFINYEFSLNNFHAVFFTIMILIIDFSFLFILKKEIKHHEEKTHNDFYFSLTNKKILIIELIVLYFSIGNPIMRACLYFISLNTIQIYIVYRIMFTVDKYLNSPIFKTIFIAGAYISIIQLTIYPFYRLYELVYL